MIDWGLITLFVVMLALISLAFHAWRGIKADADRITSIIPKIDAVEKLANEALHLAREVQGTHYKALLKRIDESEAAASAFTVKVEGLTAKMATLGGRLSSLQRWHKGKAPEPAAEVLDQEDEDEQENMFPVEAPAPGNVQVTGRGFGRIAARKVG